MNEALVNHESKPQIIMVAGMGCRLTSSIMLPMMKNIYEDIGLSVASIDGTFINAEGDLEVSPPSQQVKEVDEIMEENDTSDGVLIVSHCIGALALIDKIACSDSQDKVRGLLISPPIPSPLQTIQSDRVQNKIFTRGHTTYMKTADFSATDPYNFDKLVWKDAIIKPDFIEEIQLHDKSSNFVEQIKQLSSLGKVGLSIPLRDWNTEMIEATSNWPGPVIRIPDAGHALNANDGSIEKQKAMCLATAEFGLNIQATPSVEQPTLPLAA